MKFNLPLVAAIICVILPSARPQSPRQETIVVRGEISSSFPVNGLSVELSSSGMPSETAFVNPDDSFEFPSATCGVHQIRVIASNGQVLYEEYVSLSPNQTLSIRIPDRPSNNHNARESTTSLQQLQHKVPAAAQKAFQKGEGAAAKGDFGQARLCFEEAVSRDPEFADAYNELGATDARLNNLPEAAAQFQKAIDLVPEHPKALPNLSVVLAKMERYHEAGQVARRALQVVPSDGRVHYILASSLLQEHGNIDEIIAHLERASVDIPSARLTAAQLLAQSGRPQEAVNQLKDYLVAAKPSDPLRTKAEALLAQLRK
jgi:tetratricopeptide (TPR) repeat protein